jgi:hypothetical protein
MSGSPHWRVARSTADASVKELQGLLGIRERELKLFNALLIDF